MANHFGYEKDSEKLTADIDRARKIVVALERGFKWPAMEDCLNLERGFFEAAHCAFDNAVVALEKHRDELNAPGPEAESDTNAPDNEPLHIMERRINELFAASNRRAADAEQLISRQWERMDALENKVAALERKAESTRQAIPHGPEYRGRR